MLTAHDFSGFFQEIHGCDPFPWQTRLLRRIAEDGAWPRVLDLPTGSGKTAALDIATFHLALEADHAQRRAPVRIAFVVDRRLVVDDAFARARRLEQSLAAPPGPITALVAERLRTLSSSEAPLLARRLRGGIPREDDWARTPAQPTLLCSTVDQIGSRLLFRGYGVSDSMKPVHAGLIGSDCLILLDEAHLAEPFRQTLEWVRIYRGRDWRECDDSGPWGISLLTATPGETSSDAFSLDDADRSHPVLSRRLSAPKPARLVAPGKGKAEEDGTAGNRAAGNEDIAQRVAALVLEVQRAIEHFEKVAQGAPCPAIGVVVNRVSRARAVFQRLKQALPAAVDPMLLIGPARPVERDALAGQLAPIRTGEPRRLDRPLVIVATQCIEAGVDIDLDGLVTEAAPLDALRQRFGRLNRAGRDIRPYAAVVAARADIAARADDAVYGGAIAAAWRVLIEASKASGGKVVDFGVQAFSVRLDREALSPRVDAPILLPAHLDLLSQTSPIPAADPDVALFLHGPNRQPDSIAVVWRADIDAAWQRDDEVRRLLILAPPRSLEAIQLPLWAVRRWLARGAETAGDVADVACAAGAEDETATDVGRPCFRWAGNDERSRWIRPARLRPGDTVVVPVSYGGVDRFGWNPASDEPAVDVGREAALPFAGRRFSVRIAPGLLGDQERDDALADALGAAGSQRWRDLREAVLQIGLPPALHVDLLALDRARGGSVVARTDVHGIDEAGRARGVVFVAPFGIDGAAQDEEGVANSTEDDASGSLPGFRLTLARHSADVETKAEQFARACLVDARVRDLRLAGLLHDAGKADQRFQRWLHYGDPLGPDPDDSDSVLAKSARPLPPAARAESALPPNWRHEALSVRLARSAPALDATDDPDLVLWLIGSHHGHGRPLYPHADPLDRCVRKVLAVPGLPGQLSDEPGPQSLAFDWRGDDWVALFRRLKVRYGWWELARMEAILRLADHRASEEAGRAAWQRSRP